MNEQELKKLYNALINKGYSARDLGDEQRFMSKMQYSESRRQLYDYVKKRGDFRIGDYNAYEQRLTTTVTQQNAPETGQASVPSTSTPTTPTTPPETPSTSPTPSTHEEETPAPSTPVTSTPSTWKPENARVALNSLAMLEEFNQGVKESDARVSNMRKGAGIGNATSELKFNPEKGKVERVYYTTHGDEVTTPLGQARLNQAYTDEWEATTEEGYKHKERRLQNDFERRVSESLSKYDPDNTAEIVWQRAESEGDKEFKAWLDERNKPTFRNAMRDMANASNATGSLGMDNIEVGIEAFATHLKSHDLQRMADNAWNMLGKEKQDNIIKDMYGALKNRYPQATSEQLQQAATEMAREQSDLRMYELAVAKNAPRDATEYFFRKVFLGNSIGSMMQAAARAKAGTTGDMEAREDAEQRFEKQGHKFASIAGTVVSFAMDPLTYVSAGAGSSAVKGATWLGGKFIGNAAMRKFGTSLGGRMLFGAVGGGVNFATLESGSEMTDQMKWGGYIDEETGKRIEGFSFGNVARRARHGLIMGGVTGVIAPLIGNVSDKLVSATESTVGKMGIRATELGVGTVAEGTIFAVPEIIDSYNQYGDLINSLSDEESPNYIADEQERAAKIEELRNSRGDAIMDVWTDNMAMIAGFKAQHMVKSAPRVITDLASSKNKAGFETRLRQILDGRPDLALTKDEKIELERRGYGDLKDLTEEYARYAKTNEEYAKTRPTTTDASRLIGGELPYNRFVDLMTDNSVSEAARAKMYYYLTGHSLPMSTITGSSITENKDADGNVIDYTVQSLGVNGIITSRSFANKKRADVEVNRINRQAELNSIDVGERYYDWKGDNKRMYEACNAVAEETGAPANLLFDLMKRKTEAMNEVELQWAEKILKAYEGLGDKYGTSEVRSAINGEFGVDVDKAIRKERNRRSEQEQKAVEEYANRLFADVKRKQEEAAERGEAPVDPDAPTTDSQIAGLLGIDDGEQGDPASAAFNRGHEADAQERQDIAIELTDPNNAEAQEAWNGVVQRINEDAAYLAAQQREQSKQMQHTDGSFRAATLKEKDENGHDKQAFIVDGNVQMMADGMMVDPEASDKSVVIFDPTTGERRMIDPTADTGILSVDEVTTAEQHEANIERSRQEYVQAQIDEAQGTVRLSPGQQLVLPTGEEAVVVATDADGENITVALGDGTQATVQRSELQRIHDEKALADYRQRHGITEEPATQQTEAPTPAQPQANGRVAGAPAEYTADMELTIRDEDGSEKPAMVMGRVRYENGSFVPDANGNIIEYFMDGEVKHDHEDKLVDKVVSHVAPAQPEQGNNTQENIPVQGNNDGENIPQAPIETPTPVEQPAEIAPQPVQEHVQTVEPQPAQPEAPVQATEQPTTDAMPMREDGEEDWQATTPERAHAYIFNEAGLSRSEGNEFIAAQIQSAQSAISKAKSAKMPKIGTSIKAYNEAKAKRQEKIDEAQRVLDYWNGVQEIQNAIQREENERRAAEQAVLHDEAVAQAQAEYEARKQAEEERKAVGNENPMPAITEKWNNANKVDGHRDEIMLPDGTPLKGHYVLHESGASSPSHNPETWHKTDGFPMDANDNSVNDRDYERDRDAQEHTQSIARQYDQRALQSVPVVSNDGVVLSGNGRTMAGELAARDNTDGAYVDYLKEYAHKFGFTPEQVEAMQHPRVSFVPDEAMPYTAETFAKFNQQEMKSQNKTEQAVKLGKTVSDDIFKGIVRTINGYDTLGNFYNDAQASLGAVYDLHNAGVVPQAQLAEMVDGVRGQEKLSAVGREFLENMLIGKAFESDPEAVRMLTAEPAMRQTVITALGDIVDNIALGGDWSLQGELADAVKLCFDARQGGAKYGEIVSTYARQGVLFADPDELQTVADFNNATMLMLADVLNDKRVTLLKITLQLYNNNARQSAAGQTDLFAGGIKSREDILRDVITFINENYGKRKEIEAARAAAVERRKAESVQQDGTPPAVSTDGEAGQGERTNSQHLAERQGDLGTTVETSDIEFDEDGLPFVISSTGTTVFGEIKEETGLPPAPIKLSLGNSKYGLVHLEKRHGKQIRNAGFNSVEEFVEYVCKNYKRIRQGENSIGEENGTYLLQIEDNHNNTLYVELSTDGSYWGVNSGGVFRKEYGNNKKEVWSASEVQNEQSATDSTLRDEDKSDNPTTPNGIVPPTSDSKDIEKSRNSNELGEKSDVSSVQGQLDGFEGYSREEVKEMVLDTVSEILSDVDVEIVGIELHGSRNRGDSRADSDLDVVLEYSGDFKEDAMFNLLHADPIEINGVVVDVNPIRKEESGTLADYMKRSRGYDAMIREGEVNTNPTEAQKEAGKAVSHDETVAERTRKIAERFSKMAEEEERWQGESNAVPAALTVAEQETNVNPTEAQKEAGNYKKGHVKIDGYDVTIENPKGSVRSGVDADGKKWETEMQNTYGYIRGTEGVDGDHIDVFFSEDPSQGDVFVVDQVNKDGSFDEHKVMYGFPDIESARKAYLSNYNEGWQGLGTITGVSKEEFKKWINSSHRKTKPFAEYKSVKTTEGQSAGIGEIKPIGRGAFGNIYDQFKGKTKEAYKFLLKHKEGDLLGVFQRDGFGGVDLVWGNKSGGAEHIIDKHVGEGKSFATEEDAFTEIDRIIKSGEIDFENGDKVVFKSGNKLVTIRKNWRENGKKIADKNWVLTAYDEKSADSESPVATNKSLAGSATDKSHDKDTIIPNTNNKSGHKFNKGERFVLSSGATITIQDVNEKGERIFTWKSINNDNLHTSKATVEELEIMGAKPLEKAEKEAVTTIGGREFNIADEAMESERGSEAFARATEATMEALENTGVEVVMATEEMVAEMISAVNAERQMIADANERFNRELQQQIDGTLPKGHVYELGMPSAVLQSAGLPYLPIELAASRLTDKSMQENHPFELSEVENLVESVQNPLAVFRSATHIGSYVVLTEIQHGGKNYVVAIETHRKQGKNEINSVRSVHYRNSNKHIANWIEEGLLEYADKKRMSEWLSKQRYNSADVRNLFRHSAKIVESFENPKDSAEFSRMSAPFYSNARRAVLEIKQEKGTPEQWIAMLKKNGGLKAGEDAWVGLEKWLNERKGTVTKQEIVDYLNEKSIQIEEVEYGDPILTPSELVDFELGIKESLSKGCTIAEAIDKWDVMTGDNMSYFYEAGKIKISESGDVAVEGGALWRINSTRLEYTTKGLKGKREIVLTVPTIEPYNTSDEIHFGEAGSGRAVAWVRFGETEDSEGNRVLVIDEIQSKRHQDGREKGYKSVEAETQGAEALEAARKTAREYREYHDQLKVKYGDPMEVRGTAEERKAARRQWREQLPEEERTKLDELRQRNLDAAAEYERISLSNRHKVPEAPFEKNWHELAMKRMLRYAAENGYDKVAWTTGAQQAERYDISRLVEEISVEENTIEEFSDGTPVAARITISTTSGDIYTDIDAEGVVHGGEYSGKELEDVVGKELANRIKNDILEAKQRRESAIKAKASIQEKMKETAEDGAEYEELLAEYGRQDEMAARSMAKRRYSGGDLRIGGEGMKGFYDKMLPSFVQKYTKKWGARVGEVTLPGVEESGRKMHAVDVTAEMRESVMEGQPMFLRTSDGKIYGWSLNGKIYLTADGVNPETPVHEYTHLWANALEQSNPKEWKAIVEGLKGSSVWNDVMRDEHYRDIWHDERRVASEVLSRLAGKENYRREMERAEQEIKEATNPFDVAEKVSAWERVKEALRDFWNKVKRLLTGKAKEKSEVLNSQDEPWIEFVERPLRDFWGGVNPNVKRSPMEKMFVGERGAQRLDKDTEDVAREDQIFLYDNLGDEGRSVDTALYRSSDAIKDRIEVLFNQAISGEFKGKPISIGRLTESGKRYLEQISGVSFKDKVDFVLNPSDLVHIYKGHFGNNETDERGVPLDIEDIRSIVDVVSFPDRIIYAKEKAGEKRKMFFFLKEAEKGTYNLLEIYADKKGNLTAKTFYKTKEGVSQRAMTLSKSLHTTSETDGATLNDDANIPQMFENPSVGVDYSGEDSDMMRSTVEQMGEKLHTDINIIEDVNEITHPNAEIEANRRGSKGWYETATGQVNIVLSNNRDVEDVKATVAHETIAHKGLRELIGEERYGEFLDETYQHLYDDLKKGVDAAAGRAFVDDITKNGERAESYEHHRRNAMDELFGRMAEKPFEEFSEGERTLWQKIEATVRRLLDKFLGGSLKLPKWFKIGGNELRYMLWRSKERLERGKEHPIDLARDIVKREELGLTEEARYKMGDEANDFHTVINEMFDNADFDKAAHQRERYDLGKTPTWMKRIGVAGDRFSLSFKNIKSHLGKDADHNLTAKEWHQLPDALKNPFAVTRYNDANDRFRLYVNIMHNGNYVAVGVDVKRVNQGRNLPMLEVNSIKTVFAHHGEIGGGEKLITYDKEITPEQEALLRGLNFREYPTIQELSVAKVANDSETASIGSQKVNDSTDLYRGPGETEDIWNDMSMDLQERITAAATRLANNHRDNKTLRNDAMRAIGGNLSDLRKAMSLQRTFDMTTVKRVADLARVLISNGYLNDLSPYEIKRLLSAVKNSVGHNDIEGDVQKVMDIMVDNQLKLGESALHELEAIRGSKVDARGVEVQGQLDPAGAHTMKVFKETRGLTREALEEEIGKTLDRMSSASESVRADAENAYAGLQFALQYAERIADSKHAEKVLRDELKQKHDETSERDRRSDGYRQYVAATEDAIRQNKIERAQSYFDLVSAMTDGLRESVANAKAFKESERKRIQDIHHFANSDMQGMELRGHRADSRLDRLNENSVVRFGLSPLHTFDQFMRLFGRKNADGKGYLYDHFMRNFIDSDDHERLMKEKYEGMLEAKVGELFGTHRVAWNGGMKKVPYTFTSLYGYVDALPMSKVTYYDGAGLRTYDLSQAQLAYLYAVDKMPMGKTTNRRMGVTDELMEQIAEGLDPKLKEFVDWAQEDFLVGLGNECNEVHKRMFGANMANIENYFPFVRDKNAIKREVENGGGESLAERISTKTGAIIKRTPSVANWDLPNANFLDVLAKHVSEMCQWASYAELNRDLGTLQSYNRFKQQVIGMRTIYGSGDALWKRFMQTCAIAGKAYEPKRGEADKLMVKGAKGVTMGKIAFRPFTALKQVLSLPAFFGEVDLLTLSADLSMGGVPAVKWAWENMPNFRKRIKSRTTGDFRLSETEYDKEKGWTNRLMKISSYGMMPNIGVDAWTIALGSHAVYVKAKEKYLRQGYSDEKAERRAIQDAELCFNKSQQSSEGAFMAPVQIDHTFASTTMMMFRNSSTSYTRETITSVRNLKRMMSGEVDVDFMAKQILRNAEIPTFSMRFDAELEQQVDGTLPVGHIYSLGMPGGVLQSAGFPDAPIEMSSTRLAEKANDPSHPFPIAAVKGLVDAMNEPIAVFRYGNNAMNVIVGLEYKGKQFLVGVHFNQHRGGMDVLSVRGLFPKDNAEWLNWISQGKATYLDHKRIKALIAQQRINLADVDYLDLKDVLKVMENFENPAIPEQKKFGEWRDEDVKHAREQARKEYRGAYIRNSVNAVMFGFILPWLWRIGGLGVLLVLGGDDDKNEAVSKATKQSLFGPLEGFAYGDVLADGLYVGADKLFGSGEEKWSNLGRTNPFLSDLAGVLRKLDGDKMSAINDVLNILVGMNTGVNLQTVSDWATAILDYSPDGDTSREVSLLVARLLNAPQSQIEKIYFDEIGMDGEDALRLSPQELVERYAAYKVKRDHFVTPWVWGDENLLDKQRKKGEKVVNERVEQMGDDKVNEAYLQYEEVYKGVNAKMKEANKMLKTDYVEAAQLMADIQKDTKAFETYQMFKMLDGYYDKIVEYYLGSKTSEEATLCKEAALAYKSGMVKVLQATDTATRAEAMKSLENILDTFTKKHTPMQQNTEAQ